MTDARVSRIIVESLVDAPPNARVSRITVESLVSVTPTAKVSRVLVEALVSTNAALGTAPQTPSWSWVSN